MPKSSTLYICQTCEFQSPKWIGQCPNCGSWNTLVETIAPTSFSTKYTIGSSHPAQAVTLSDLKHLDRSFVRIPSGMEEFDRVVGGGIVLGSVNLIGGEPGIGKSTLLTQIVINLLKDTSKEYEIMYICGEESPEQIELRIKRMSGTALPQAVAKRLE